MIIYHCEVNKMNFKKFCDEELFYDLSKDDIKSLIEAYSSNNLSIIDNITSYSKEFNIDYNKTKNIILDSLNNKLINN